MSPQAGGGANRFLTALRAARDRPIVIAHRGDSAHAPENTLVAARRGFEAGADAWEFDVQLTRDGVPVVIHDESLLRTTDVARRFPDDPRAADGYPVSEFDFDEIRALDAGAWFPNGEDGDWRLNSDEIRVPTLAECLELTASLGWMANIELKSFPNANPELVPRVADEVRAAGLADRVLISSFDHRDVARAAREGIPWATGVLTMTPLYRPEHYVRGVVGADCFHASTLSLGVASSAYLRRGRLEDFQAAGLSALAEAGVPVLVYTVNGGETPGLASQLARAGVAGLFTDFPGALRNELDHDPGRVTGFDTPKLDARRPGSIAQDPP